MRKQYHFQPSAKGFYAWDIDKLVEKSKNLPVISIRLEEIKELDENFWYQSPDAIPTCRSIADHMRLVNETSLEHPIILSPKNRVMDGMHRVMKAYLNGDETIRAVRLKEDPEPDFTDVSPDDLPYQEI